MRNSQRHHLRCRPERGSEKAASKLKVVTGPFQILDDLRQIRGSLYRDRLKVLEEWWKVSHGNTDKCRNDWLPQAEGRSDLHLAPLGFFNGTLGCCKEHYIGFAQIPQNSFEELLARSN